MKSDIVNPFPDTENVSLQKRPGLALESIHSFWGPVPWRPGCVAIGVWREPGRWLLLCEGAFAAEWLVKTGPSPLFFLRLCGVSRCFKGTVYIHTFCHISVGGNIFCSGKSTCFFVGYLKATRSTVRSLKPWKGAKSPEADWDGTATQCFPFSWHPRKRMTIPSEWYIYIYHPFNLTTRFLPTNQMMLTRRDDRLCNLKTLMTPCSELCRSFEVQTCPNTKQLKLNM